MYYFIARDLYNLKTPTIDGKKNFINLMHINGGLYLNFAGYCLYNHTYQPYRKLCFGFFGLGSLFIYNGFQNMTIDN